MDQSKKDLPGKDEKKMRNPAGQLQEETGSPAEMDDDLLILVWEYPRFVTFFRLLYLDYL
jgi:hypothetical protein